MLLAFCNTWTTACLSDWSVVEKITSKHVKNLKVVGIVVHTDRVTVERHLLQHPRRFPVVLSTENEMPRPYQFNVTPLYIVIDRNGNIAAAMQRSQGLADLTGALKKAGLEPE